MKRLVRKKAVQRANKIKEHLEDYKLLLDDVIEKAKKDGTNLTHDKEYKRICQNRGNLKKILKSVDKALR